MFYCKSWKHQWAEAFLGKGLLPLFILQDKERKKDFTDGAVPVNLVSDLLDVRRRLNTPVMRIGPLLLYLVGMGYRLTPDEYSTLTIELNRRREQLPSAYEKLDWPVALVLSAKTAGEKGTRAERNNALWRAGGEQLAIVHPTLSIQWLDNTHLLPFKEPIKLARSLDDFVGRIQADAALDAQRIRS
ncbi:MAG TPA: hypothetical protein VFN02_12110 [Ktedonobacteraceae bacterium]|nr:hypothetical protein [Ktedonobacteraceae bacterium]